MNHFNLFRVWKLEKYVFHSISRFVREICVVQTKKPHSLKTLCTETDITAKLASPIRGLWEWTETLIILKTITNNEYSSLIFIFCRYSSNIHFVNELLSLNFAKFAVWGIIRRHWLSGIIRQNRFTVFCFKHVSIDIQFVVQEI